MSEDSSQSTFRFWLGFLTLIVGFAFSLSLIITLVFFGWPLLIFGVQSCGPLIVAGEWAVIPYTGCGCGLVAWLLLGLSLPAMVYLAPRLLRQMRHARDRIKPTR
ncbi:MAG: hypothetical protein KTR14_04855 [Vampirovibrio sp.]|nr:hypothetical protein [Vampirovibrio sp.]